MGSGSFGVVAVKRRPALLLLVLLLAVLGPFAQPLQSSEEMPWAPSMLELAPLRDLVGVMGDSEPTEDREAMAMTTIGRFTSSGLQPSLDLSPALQAYAPGLWMVIVSPEVPIATVRSTLDGTHGIDVQAYLAPSGLLITAPGALAPSEGVLAIHPVPVGLLVHADLHVTNDAMVDVRIEAWREGSVDALQALRATVEVLNEVDERRIDARIGAGRIPALAAMQEVAWIEPIPSFHHTNDLARSHMGVNQMRNQFTTPLDGSGQIVAVADSGLDGDHGDFGERVLAAVDVIGDGSSADVNDGHGTHVACSVLGDGSQGGYAGVAPEAELYFQAMENDASGNLMSPSLNSLLNTAYSNGARIHTNSWGSKSDADHGRYTSDSEDVDDRMNTYDRAYGGSEGLVVLFAAGNDGSDSDTIVSPGTAKNAITVGNHHGRGGGAPDTIVGTSSRGPTDDGRIKPDVIAPGGWVRSCRSQDATDISRASWSNANYMEYTGTSMATPNAAGTAALIREYVTEVALRPAPQGSLVKAMMILGARDVGARDVPNNDEGWGRVDLANTLAPSGGRGIWVDDRSALSSTGAMKTYTFNVSQSGLPFKAVLAWSDERGSRWSETQLVNDLDLTVIAPDGTLYLGNDFASGRSTTGGTKDTLNPVEVVLIDTAPAGVWTVRVRDGLHAGSKVQPFSIAVSGVGVNDLRPDPLVVPGSLAIDPDIPQVGEPATVRASVQNFGNIEAEDVNVSMFEEGDLIGSTVVDLTPGAMRTIEWSWMPQVAAPRNITVHVDPMGSIDEISEINNVLVQTVEVTTPGVRIDAVHPNIEVTDPLQTTATWTVELTNTALLPTNATLEAAPIRSARTGADLSWYVALSETNFDLGGSNSSLVNVSVVHPSPPEPGTYELQLTGRDADNDVAYPYTLTLEVPELADLSLFLDYSIVSADPVANTSIEIRLRNDGNAPIGYNLFLNSPSGWSSGFDDLGSQPGAPSGSTGLMAIGAMRTLGVTFVPSAVMTAGGSLLNVDLVAVAQTDLEERASLTIPLVVQSVERLDTIASGPTGAFELLESRTFDVDLINRGNVDLDLNTTVSAPDGWTVLGAESLEIPWARTSEQRIEVMAGIDAVPGDLVVRWATNGTEFTWSVPLTVLIPPNPRLTLISVSWEGDGPFDSFAASTPHPIDEPITITWLIDNPSETDLEPVVTLEGPTDVIGDCTGPDRVVADAPRTLTCTLVMMAQVPPGAERTPELVLRDEGVLLRTPIPLQASAPSSVTWEVPQDARCDTDVVLVVRNDGATTLEHRVRFLNEGGVTFTSDDATSVRLEPGREERITVVPSCTGGPHVITVVLEGADHVEGSSTTLTLTGEMATNEVQALGWVLPGAGGLIVLLGLIVGLMVLKRRRAFPSTSTTIPCWGCGTTITQPVRSACPGCGARYHAPPEPCATAPIPACRRCGASAEGFRTIAE